MRDSLGNLTYLHSDHLGSVSLATTSNGNIASQQYFDPWGKVKSGGIGQTSLNYTGQRLDGTGLLYYNARYYDPALGKFLSPDNVSDGVNRYAYVHNNPLNKADPTGHCPWCIIGAIGGAVIGGVADAGVQFFTTGKVDVGQVALATLTGAVIGGTMGLGATAFAGGAGAAEVATTVGGAVAAESGAINEVEGEISGLAEALSGRAEVAASSSEEVANSAISMDKAIELGVQHAGSDARLNVSGSGGYQFIGEPVMDSEGNAIRNISRFDINSASTHVQQEGPHLNLEWQINGDSLSDLDPHIPIDPTTIRPGDIPY